MSLAVLKNKSRRYKATVSGRNKGGFSIVGGRRNQGWVGQDNLGRHLVRTPFRGNEPIGYGGTDGKYVRAVISNAGFCCTNDPSIIKRSTMNNSGLLLTSVKHPTGVFHEDCDNKRCRGDWVKDFEPLNHSQSGHIKRIKVATACGDNRCDGKKEDAVLEPADCECLVKSSFIGGKKHYAVRITKSKFVDGAISMGEYIDVGVMQKNDLPTPANKQAFPMTLNHVGCDINYITPEEAIDAGELPADWMQTKNRAEKHNKIYSKIPYNTIKKMLFTKTPKKVLESDNNSISFLHSELKDRGGEQAEYVDELAEYVDELAEYEHFSEDHTNFSEDLIDFGAFEHFITFDYGEKTPYQYALEGDFPDDWLKNTADTDIVYSVNPYL